MKHPSTVLALTACAALSACGVSGSGDYGVTHRSVSDFDRVEVQDDIRVQLDVDSSVVPGPVDLTVSGDDNLLSRVETWVSGRTLHVETDDPVWEDLELRVTGTVRYLGSAAISDGAKLYANGIHGTELTIDAEDSADVMLSGWVRYLDVYAQDWAEVDAIDLHADDVWIDIADSADVSVCADYEISGYVTGWADLWIACDPDVIDIYYDNIVYY